MSVLKQICIDKKDHVRIKKGEVPLKEIKSIIKDNELTRSFKSNIDTQDNDLIALIAEVKKASPSKGVIRENFDPVQIAKEYESAGACCLSVLTDEPYFQGHDSYIKLIKDSVSLPILRKDFMIDTYQIFESKYLGADCVLLIMAALEDAQAEDLYHTAKELGLDVLTEVHDAEELQRAIALNVEMIGINNRNLKTLEVTLQTSLDLAHQMPTNVTRISESGIYKNDDIVMLQEAGFKGFLVGESLMRQKDISLAVSKLLAK